ncbi:TM2 domain-containing protein [Deinococcus aquaedulcis]|uniref:TM2 domain-containing protein n=1 Tax=Deinococcus aquaedulcis TaxID=2840455 RepID=UPI001C82E299|nr:TM2 domain-containing protein [Deinococcus aquaedulcis]
MTNPEDNTSGTPSAAPSWVDEVLGPAQSASSPASGDLRIPEPQRPAAAPAPAWVDEVSAPGRVPADPGPAPASPAAPAWADEVTRPAHTAPASSPWPEDRPAVAPAAPTGAPQDDWVTRATGGARNPTIPQGPPTGYAEPAPARPFDHFGDPAHQMTPAYGQGSHSSGFLSSDVAQKKLFAGLLGIFLGSLGIHKFYLGNTTAGLMMLGLNIGVWVVALLLGLLTFGVALFVTVPLAGLVSSGLGLLGLVEGIIYLTKSDPEFQRDYVIGKKPWL